MRGRYERYRDRCTALSTYRRYGISRMANANHGRDVNSAFGTLRIQPLVLRNAALLTFSRGKLLKLPPYSLVR